MSKAYFKLDKSLLAAVLDLPENWEISNIHFFPGGAIEVELSTPHPLPPNEGDTMPMAHFTVHTDAFTGVRLQWEKN